MNTLQDKNLLLGITGGIAIYKVCDIVRDLVKSGIRVQIAMTNSARKFVTPLTFETLSNQPVMTGMFVENEMVATRHIDLPRDSNAVLICPATANFIGKAANGIADDLLSTMVLVAGAKKTIFCPAMNSDMWANPIVQNNLARLRESGSSIVEPEYGDLACKTVGIGRLAKIERIISKVKIELLRTNDFSGKKFLITAGPTEEALDPIRYITNFSSGKMGYALAEAALSRGGEVTLISGPTTLNPPDDAHTIFVRSAEEMKEATLDVYSDSDIIIMAAAISDYRPAAYSSSKIKKSTDKIDLSLKKTADVLAYMGKNKNGRILVGFAVETDNMVPNAVKKLKKKNLDLIVANDPNVKGAAFRADTNLVTLVNRNGTEKELSLMSKLEVGLSIMTEIAGIIGKKNSHFESTVQV